jgi:hypothetical protein
MKTRNLLLLLIFCSHAFFAQYTQTEIDAFLNAVTGTNSVGTEIIGNARYFYSNNYPNHNIGQKNGNIEPVASGSTWSMCAYPKLGSEITQLYSSTEAASTGCTGSYNFGVALNGIKFGPSSAAFFKDGDENDVQNWHLEALFFETLDGDGTNDNVYGAHSTGAGLYHYHGDPVGYFAETVINGGLGIDGTSHSPIIGYAADGYPIYYKYGYANSDGSGGLVTLDSGFQLKTGSRGGDGINEPNGNYDGEYVEDYEYTVSTKLDECNGRFAVTPEFPKGTYYYVITESWPVIPRCFAGSVLDNSFLIGPSASCGDSNAGDDCSVEVSATNSFTWTGETNTDWDTVTNWVDDSAPTTLGHVSIPNVSSETGNFPSLANNSEVAAVILYPSASLTVNSGKLLTISSDLTNLGTLTIDSDATSSGSLMISGEATGDITYNRYLTSSVTSDEGWHLVSSPVGDETIEDIITNGNLITNASSFLSLATYDNNLASSWSYINGSSTGTLEAGKGYAIKRDGSGTISFKGPYRTTVLKNYSISVGLENSWNLIGNPYPSFISVNNKVSTDGNFITVNSSNLDPSFLAIYVWNSQTKTYEVYNHSSDTAKYIAPGQAFFVNSIVGGGEIFIRENMQSHQADDLFLKSNTSTPTIILSMTDGNLQKSTEIKYVEGTTLGLDPGYDAGLFDAVSSGFNIYTYLLEDDDQTRFALQCVPLNNYDQMTFAIGIDAEKDDDIEKEDEISFSISELNLPSEIKIYLEDREKEIFYEFIDNESKYTFTLSESLNGIGRFYLHTSAKSLLIDKIPLNSIKVYNTPSNNLKISGLPNSKISINLYSSLGKKVFQKTFKSIASNNFDISMLGKGVYLVQLITENGSIHKKIVIQ